MCLNTSQVTPTILSWHLFSAPAARRVWFSQRSILTERWLNCSGCHRQSDLRKTSQRLQALRLNTESDQDESKLINISIISVWFTLAGAISKRLKWFSLLCIHLRSWKKVLGSRCKRGNVGRTLSAAVTFPMAFSQVCDQCAQVQGMLLSED